MKTTFQRIVDWQEAYDQRDANPNCGIHGAQVHFVLKSDLGAVQFLLYTSRHLEHVHKELYWNEKERGLQLSPVDEKYFLSYGGPFTPGKELEEMQEWIKFLNKIEMDLDFLFRPSGADIGYHSPKPMYDGHEPMRTMQRRMEFDPETEVMTPAIWGDPIICPYLDNDVPCYYDGSSLNSRRIAKIYLDEGEEAMWAELEEFYRHIFKD